MKINSIKYLLSAPSKKFWPKDKIKEICVIGKSNVGKSSFINALSNNSKASKVSKKPGLTKYLNFFDINDSKFRIVDTPGYGYSKVPVSLDERFLKMMEEYIFERENVVLFILLVDIRRTIKEDEMTLINLLSEEKKKLLIIGTKKDKTNQSERHLFKKQINSILKNQPVILVSKDEKNTLNEVLKIIEDYLN